MRAAKITFDRARKLRAEMTPPEALLWVRLRNRSTGCPTFRRQHPIGPYIPDFYCASARLAVEIDGQSHGIGDRPLLDVGRSQYLAEQGVRVLRYQATEVMHDPNGVSQAIFDAARG